MKFVFWVHRLGILRMVPKPMDGFIFELIIVYKISTLSLKLVQSTCFWKSVNLCTIFRSQHPIYISTLFHQILSVAFFFLKRMAWMKLLIEWLFRRNFEKKKRSKENEKFLVFERCFFSFEENVKFERLRSSEWDWGFYRMINVS